MTKPADSWADGCGMSGIAHSLVGYDRATRRVAEEFVLPNTVLPRAKELARVPAEDSDALGCYRLAESAAHDLADILEVRVDTERRDYFLEGFAVDDVITVTGTGRFDGNNEICVVTISPMDPHSPAGDFREFLGELPEPDAWEVAKLASRKRGLPLIGPHGRFRE